MCFHEIDYTHSYREINANSYLTGNYYELHNSGMDFAEWLKTEMDNKGLKQQALADRASESGEPITQATVSRILNRVQDPAFGNVVALARALGHDAMLFMRADSAPLVSGQKEPIPEDLRTISSDLAALDKDEADLWRMNLKVMAKKARKELEQSGRMTGQDRRQQGNGGPQ